MGTDRIIFAVLVYAVTCIFIIGFVGHFARWLASPNPLKIPTGPAPVTQGGTALRVLSEVVLFRSLFAADKGLWLGGYIFHLSFLIVILRHLRYFFYPVPEWVMFFSEIGIYAGFTLVLSLLYLLLRRLAIDRVRYISNFMDYLYPALIIAIGTTGLIMKYVARPIIVDIKDFMLHLMALSPIPLPDSLDGMFILHLIMVLLLIFLFPFSKLMHAGGVFITPTRAMVNNPRTKRHINPWADEEWGKRLAEAEGKPDAYKPWSMEQWREKWGQK